MKWIDALLGGLVFRWHAVIVTARYSIGRLDAFHDRPDWFVRSSADLFDLARSREHESADILRLAVAEWTRREWRRKAGRA